VLKMKKVTDGTFGWLCRNNCGMGLSVKLSDCWRTLAQTLQEVQLKN
jgi:hypothetical protein